MSDILMALTLVERMVLDSVARMVVAMVSCSAYLRAKQLVALRAAAMDRQSVEMSGELKAVLSASEWVPDSAVALVWRLAR